jgi:lysophospholipase L1-like esterase
MLTNNNHKKPFLIVAYTWLALVLISIFVPKTFWQALNLNVVSIYASLSTSPETKHASTYHKKNAALKELVADTIEANKAVAKLIRNDVAIEFADTTGNQVGLNTFLKALNQHQLKKNRKIRIGYFGDSMIEGDLITQTIRSILQNKFGGNGVGYIPVTSVVEHFRQTIRVTSSENWEDVSFINNKEKKIIGFSGHTFYPKSGASVSVKPGGGKHLSSLYQFSILFGAGDDGVTFTLNNETMKVMGDKHFNMARLSADTSLTKATLTFQPSSTPIYGFTSESKTGVILDNLSFRGTSGTEITRLNSKMLRQIDSLRHYDLIVLQYGPNLLYNDSITNFDYYQKQLEKSIKHLRKAFPGTSILIISTADKAFKINGEYRTGDGVEALLKAQQNAALKTNCAFYNLYEAMGGYNSMKTWAEKKPILAGSDYTHFNQSGSAKIGRLVGNALLNEYEKKYPTN